MTAFFFGKDDGTADEGTADTADTADAGLAPPDGGEVSNLGPLSESLEFPIIFWRFKNY